MGEAREKALAAREAATALALADTARRNGALRAMAQALRDHADAIVEANGLDMDSARDAGTKESLLDRLALDDSRVTAMADALEALAELPDPLNQVQWDRTLENGLRLTRVSVPLGVVAVVYEARPNVTADAAGICLKAGNAVVLRGGSLARHSNGAIVGILRDAAASAGLPCDCIQGIDSIDRAETDELMGLHGIVDVLVPRGGAGLIQHCVDCAKVPVIETGTGNCHVYVHGSADLDWALDILLNAKCRRYGVCNAAETLLVDAQVADVFLPRAMEALCQRGVILHTDEYASNIAAAAGVPFDLATVQDWETEYLAPEIAVRVVSDLRQAISHINRYSTKHSEAIVASDQAAIDDFCAQVDAAAVYVNASTAFTDGGEFGLGAEIGISTQKLHVRGPFALEALTTYKYIVVGEGAVRS